MYQIFKQNLSFEKCLDHLPVKQKKKSNHRLPVLRWYDIPLNERLCILYNKGLIGDEFPFILECLALEEIRGKHLNANYWKRPIFLKLSQPMTNCNCKSQRKLCVFISNSFDAVCSY